MIHPINREVPFKSIKYLFVLLILFNSCNSKTSKTQADKTNKIESIISTENSNVVEVAENAVYKIISVHPSSNISGVTAEKAESYIGKIIILNGLEIEKNIFSSQGSIQFSNKITLDASNEELYNLSKFAKVDGFDVNRLQIVNTSCELPLSQFYLNDSAIIFSWDGFLYKANKDLTLNRKSITPAKLPITSRDVTMKKYDLDISLLPVKEFMEPPYYALLPTKEGINIFILKYLLGDYEETYICTFKENYIIDKQMIKNENLDYSIDSDYNIRLEELNNDESKFKNNLIITKTGSISQKQ